MKNDEKIDIILSEEIPEEELSREEQIQLNYDKAMRYIGIAEHMKQYEEQDKYYHRAIMSLKKVNDDGRFDDLVRELNYIKFKYRSEGKFRLYEEACKIRDTAKTPQDYYSAQAANIGFTDYLMENLVIAAAGVICLALTVTVIVLSVKLKKKASPPER